MVTESMDVDDYVQNVVVKLDSKDTSQVTKSIKEIKNLIIGNNKYKSIYIQDDIVAKVLELIAKFSTNYELITEIVITIGSFSKGSEIHVKKLIDKHQLNSKLIQLLFALTGDTEIAANIDSNHSLKLVESCLRCLKNLYKPFSINSNGANHECIYKPTVLKMLFRLYGLSNSTKESVIELFASTCSSAESQRMLLECGAVPIFASLLTSPIPGVQLAALKLFNALSFENRDASKMIHSTIFVDCSLSEIVATCLSRDKPIEVQLYAAKCLTNLCRSQIVDFSCALIKMKTLPALIRLCQKHMSKAVLVQSISTLAYLIELSADLQETASYLEQIVPTLAHYVIVNTHLKADVHETQEVLYLRHSYNLTSNTFMYQMSSVHEVVENVSMRLAAVSFHTLSSLAANNEDVRRRISDQDGLMGRLVDSIKQNGSKTLRIGALCLLHSLSRSVQQLRTKFLDHKIWTPIIDLIQYDDEHIICITTAILSNLLLEFSPSKETMIEYGIINMLVKLVNHQNISIKVNSMWALMNMAFQADQKVKQQILSAITMDKLFQLLTEDDENLIIKTLGLLRNLICTKPHIDQIMSTHGTKALCILSNVADGNGSKEFIMGNEDLLRKINSFMTHNCTQLQIAAVFCIANLVWNTDENTAERRNKLQEMGVQKVLQKILHSAPSDPVLYDKITGALQNFP